MDEPLEPPWQGGSSAKKHLLASLNGRRAMLLLADEQTFAAMASQVALCVSAIATLDTCPSGTWEMVVYGREHERAVADSQSAHPDGATGPARMSRTRIRTPRGVESVHGL
jgi:hypothetical protein